MKDFFKPLVLLALIILSGSVLVFNLWHLTRSPAVRFSRSWREDLELLRTHHKLPGDFRNLYAIEIKGGDAGAKALLRNTIVPLRTNPKGEFALEVLITSWRYQNQWGLILQYDLLDKNNNTVWELGRTLSIPGKPPTHGLTVVEDPPTG